MPSYDFAAQRLFVDERLEAGARMIPDGDRLNYLLNVLRLREGDGVLLFNGRDGEWLARLEKVTRRSAELVATTRAREQTAPCDLHYCFAPLKHARLDYMAQKATEMGASRLVPIITRRTQARRVNLTRLRANAIEAAEQCGVLGVPEVAEEVSLDAFLAGLCASRLLVFCDEAAEIADPVAALRAAPEHEGIAVIIGPEGGFDEEERRAILSAGKVARLALGPRILRADTAAVAALAIVQTTIGDWR
ncbi:MULTISPECIES: 16S rRNA (uracil(1498)-N(3))-methyltransferase [Methylosinus]|uniref:Ribosomal RNA small subunit methyltransferase E n=1 Tax=Methylosinus trichosporium (strain ATCC 35070 / NCIMB 11131 / UNIQEM 75 / OB3b) TaxID=595536 RepID=A0A2D2D3D2_METT3|nr:MULTISPECIES: 16S rRNA (uracil(1498)-N(3))-methyltransferase [Methylosinus]ATQ69487.1 16S rRNA (uracil(1498)-N(3))-methyltransferase [Methylosinus trichosporium OB3b]OBS51936.1 16S rRNA (uracil(1498)-N(3))-methyltransferase [Methylosinus sp. 3S-1]